MTVFKLFIMAPVIIHFGTFDSEAECRVFENKLLTADWHLTFKTECIELPK